MGDGGSGGLSWISWPARFGLRGATAGSACRSVAITQDTIRNGLARFSEEPETLVPPRALPSFGIMEPHVSQ